MKQPCKICIVGPICKEPCTKLIRYVKSSKEVGIGRPGGCPFCGTKGYHVMTTGAFSIISVCSKCDWYFTKLR